MLTPSTIKKPKLRTKAVECPILGGSVVVRAITQGEYVKTQPTDLVYWAKTRDAESDKRQAENESGQVPTQAEAERMKELHLRYEQHKFAFLAMTIVLPKEVDVEKPEYVPAMSAEDWKNLATEDGGEEAIESLYLAAKELNSQHFGNGESAAKN